MTMISKEVKGVFKMDNRINHLQFSLKNVQDNIHFVDKKVGAAVTIMSMALGFVVPKELVGERILASVLGMNFFLDFVVLATALACVICFCIVMKEAIHTLVPRPPRYEKCKKLVLFPYAGTDRDYEECKQDIGDKLKDDADGWILDEFQNQLPILGWIQAQKMMHCNAMFKASRWLVESVIVLVVLCVIPRNTVVTYENHTVNQTAVFKQYVGPHDGVRAEIRSSEDDKCFIQGVGR